MKRALISILAALALAVLSCSGEEKSSTCCEEACRIWDGCSWPYETCMNQCTSEGDWCGSYIACIRGKSCQELQVCE